MPFITRNYLVERLKKIGLDCAFQDNSDYFSVYVRHRDFEIQYIVRQHDLIDETIYYIKSVEFVDYYRDYQKLYEIEKQLEPILDEFIELSDYLKVERNK